MDRLIEVAERMLAKMKEGKSINPYEYKAVLQEALAEAKSEKNSLTNDGSCDKI